MTISKVEGPSRTLEHEDVHIAIGAGSSLLKLGLEENLIFQIGCYTINISSTKVLLNSLISVRESVGETSAHARDLRDNRAIRAACPHSHARVRVILCISKNDLFPNPATHILVKFNYS